MISKRLRIIGDMVNTKNVYDVGCDHAILDIYLYKTKNTNCVAIDKSKNCIKKSLENIQKSHSKVELILNDGLNNIKLKQDSTVILSGLGTKTILEIVSKSKPETVICQSNNDIYSLRKEMMNLGYSILNEEIVLEEKYYIIIKFIKEKTLYTDDELIIGPIFNKKENNLYMKYLNIQKQIIKKNIIKYTGNKKIYYTNVLNVINKALS